MNVHFLKKALQLAKKRQGFCAPNPAVGALVVKDGQIIGKGFHLGSGKPHAEVEALQHLDKDAKGATLYVTLEPCCHWGKTPPCTDFIKRYQLKKVVYAFMDPNPKVAGRGALTLKEAGIPCEHSPLAEINQFYRSYEHWWRTHRPYVTIKLAMSLDGKIAGQGGTPLKITGEEAEKFTHRERKKVDAILTTAQTIKQDDPHLNVRMGKKQYKKPLYVLDSGLTMPLTAKVLTTTASITVFHRHNVEERRLKAFADKGVRLVPMALDSQGLQLLSVLAQIGKDGLHALWVEAGGRCFSSFVSQGLVNKAFIYVAPCILGVEYYGTLALENLLTNALSYRWGALGRDGLCEVGW
jgi:diaminohydroxyphosphoribosylaminopyrimidine deaminase / 5-amino-6-(5-phosphoribosylamino)uracil reductase